MQAKNTANLCERVMSKKKEVNSLIFQRDY